MGWPSAVSSPPSPNITAVENFAYELLIAGTLHRETDDKPFAGDVARELLRNAPCDLLLVPRPLEEPTPPQHIVFAFEPEPEEEDCELLRRAVQVLRPRRVTIAITDTPFASAILIPKQYQGPNRSAFAIGINDVSFEHDRRIRRTLSLFHCRLLILTCDLYI